MAPAALSLLTTTFTEVQERARAFGVYGAIAGGGAAIGLVLGGTLTQLASWRWTLLINVPIALCDCRGSNPFCPGEPRAGTGELRHPRRGDGDGRTVLPRLRLHDCRHPRMGSTANARAARRRRGRPGRLRRRRTAHPASAPTARVVLDRNRGGAFLASLLVGSALLGTFLFLTYFLQETLGYSALKTGFAFLPFSGGIILGAGLASRLLPRLGPRALMVVGLLLATGGLFWFTALTVGSSYAAHVLPPEVLVSLGMGLAFVPMSSTALVGVDQGHAGVASALVNATQQVGGSLGTALLNTVAASAAATYLTSHLHAKLGLQRAAVHGYTTAFTVSAFLLAAAAVVAFALIRGRRVKTCRPETSSW